MNSSFKHKSLYSKPAVLELMKLQVFEGQNDQIEPIEQGKKVFITENE